MSKLPPPKVPVRKFEFIPVPAGRQTRSDKDDEPSDEEVDRTELPEEVKTVLSTVHNTLSTVKEEVNRQPGIQTAQKILEGINDADDVPILNGLPKAERLAACEGDCYTQGVTQGAGIFGIKDFRNTNLLETENNALPPSPSEGRKLRDDEDDDDTELPSDPFTVCTAKCYALRTAHALGIYGSALSLLFYLQFRSVKKYEPHRARRTFYIWPLAVASACDYLLSTRCISDCKHLLRRKRYGHPLEANE